MALLAGGMAVSARNIPPADSVVVEPDSLSLKFYFRQGRSLLEPDFRDNASRLDAFKRRLAGLRQDTACRIRAIHVGAYASPEGSPETNNRLSEKRAAHIAGLLRDIADFPDSLLHVYPHGVYWQRLAELVEASDMPFRDEVLDVLRNTPERVFDSAGRIVDGRMRRLSMLHGGRAWRYMNEYFFPELRSSGVLVNYEFERLVPVVEKPEPEPVAEADTTFRPEPVTEVDTTSESGASRHRPFHMAVKTNMLYDVLAVPNIGVEFYLGGDWSIGANWMYAWWKNDRKHWYSRVYGGDIAVRKWLGRKAKEKPLTGHHLGVYGQVLTYDFETGGKGHMAGTPGGSLFDRANWAAGLEYGYSLPIARKLNIDFTVGVGYMGGKYHEYVPADGHYVWQATKRRRWFGPTKAEISLVWLLGRENYNQNMKGGKR